MKLYKIQTLAILFFLYSRAFCVLNTTAHSNEVFTDSTQSSVASTIIKIGLYTDIQKVWLLHGKDTLELSAKGNQVIKNLKSNQRSKSSSEKASEFRFSPISNLSVSLNSKFVYTYPGTIIIRAAHSKLTIINETDIEEYLRGVVPYEIGTLDSARYEALKAQAVAARTYAYRHLKSRESLGFDVFADTRDQVYNGISKTTILTDNAILETKGEIISFEKQPIEAYYHSTCGGHTASLAVWSKADAPYLKAKPDLNSKGEPWCQKSSYMKWERRFAAQSLARLFQGNLSIAGIKKKMTFQKIRNLIIEDTFPDGRIAILSVLTDKGSFQVRGDKVRFLFKENGKILPSAKFTFKRSGKDWVLIGSGFGHGIGLCQMGARARAEAGETYKEILEYYYHGAEIKRFVP